MFGLCCLSVGPLSWSFSCEHVVCPQHFAEMSGCNDLNTFSCRRRSYQRKWIKCHNLETFWRLFFLFISCLNEAEGQKLPYNFINAEIKKKKNSSWFLSFFAHLFLYFQKLSGEIFYYFYNVTLFLFDLFWSLMVSLGFIQFSGSGDVTSVWRGVESSGYVATWRGAAPHAATQQRQRCRMSEAAQGGREEGRQPDSSPTHPLTRCGSNVHGPRGDSLSLLQV